MPVSENQVRYYHAAGGVVVDPRGPRVLLLRRAGRQGPDGRPEVRLPKGHIEPGESRLQAARREVAEEAGLGDLQMVADLGHQVVDFWWQGRRTIRNESYYLLTVSAGVNPGAPEAQFERLWLTWEDALTHLSYEAEREWVRLAQRAWLEQGSSQPELPG